MQESFRYIEEKCNAGRVNTVEYSDAKTSLAMAKSNVLQAKYEFIFRSKILDFYNGVSISLSLTIQYQDTSIKTHTDYKQVTQYS